MKFLNKIVTELLAQNTDLSTFNIILPGKRPLVFIKRILKEKQYSGMLPNFFTIEDLIKDLADKQPVQGIALWLYSFEVYREIQPSEDFANFLKWFPTILKDWDDILKFSDSDKAVLEYMFDDEQIKNWSENLEVREDGSLRKFLNFWQKMNLFLPLLKQKLNKKNWATSGMIHESAKNKIEGYAQKTDGKFVFCGFNAFTPVEEKLVRNLMQWDKAQCFFQADEYYINDERQEAGKFLRIIKTWKEFNESRNFNWIENDFAQSKNIKVYEVSGNITQAKVLPEIFEEINDENLSKTAVVLLDENLLPTCLDAMSSVEHLNITMGFPLKNLGFSNAMKQLFYLQKQLEKKDSSYYYNDVLSVLEELPNEEIDQQIIVDFKAKIEERNIVYISKKQFKEFLSELSYFNLFEKPSSVNQFIDELIVYCYQLKYRELDDILYENISHFEKSFKIIKNQLSPYSFDIKMETLEVLINQLVSSETIDFQGEPLQGLQVMGLLETRLLNFENIILLSTNEGKLPLGNSQNTYLPFDVRQHFHLHTFLENDSIYAYHFYRLLQDSENVHLLFNALSSGVNTGEKSRFITQIEIEDKHHQIEHIIIENSSEPINKQVIQIEKSSSVLQKLEEWKKRVSPSHLTSFIYNPVDFYLTKILGTRETSEMEEELSQRSYGNLVHYALQIIYEKHLGKKLSVSDLEFSNQQLVEVMNQAIIKLNHQTDFYEKGMNYIHKSIAERVVRTILEVDKKIISDGNTLEILSVEGNFENIDYFLNEGKTDKVSFYGFIDRIDRLNGKLRIIDYKTAKTKNLLIKEAKKEEEAEKLEQLFFRDDFKQAMQLCVYAYAVLNEKKYPDNFVECGIWSFAEANKGVQNLQIYGDEEISNHSLVGPMKWIKNVIVEILNPASDFVEEVKQSW
ncbi:PD-(D/E)XK nuclease family protein [Kaistella flava (ex Peng et al. 2021)]|uniref:PD-(D/E)XK nuclease family protein n=1 Tax=Kaistella flava (ex Peng et al. 2021) TaxID=2038776 RepID=A0A7M2Y598_9FLAO|nr:PD-(D/E)XK nuclease family protein [Kaistella flava (ex Peng et al. 2021)]QOW09418.1 PD-(D/E)XK nuclease family protein [Kaistella flava (ex Peng et al. 2021)]